MKSIFCSALLFFLVSYTFAQDAEVEVCEGNTICLFEELPVGIDPGGTWTDPEGAFVECVTVNSSNEEGIYTYNYFNSEGNPVTYELLVILIETVFLQGDTLQICENGSFCMFPLLPASPGPFGTWSGPEGWIWGGTDCGDFNPDTDPPGTYLYSEVGQEGCVNNYTIHLQYTNLGIVQSVAYCNTAFLCLENLLSDNSLPTGGTWYGPDGVVISDCLDPTTAIEGVYTYEYFDEGNCLTTAGIDIEFGDIAHTGAYTEYGFCDQNDSFSPFEVMNGNPDEGGQWVLYEGNDDFVTFFSDWDLSLSAAYLQENLNDPSNFYLVYILGIEPCPPSFDTLQVSTFQPFNPGPDIEISVCYDPAPIDLNNYLGFGAEDSGLFTDPFSGDTISNMVDASNYNEGDTIQANYTGGIPNSSCQNSALIEIILLPSDISLGDDVNLDVCENDPAFDLNDFIAGNPNEPEYEGIWTGPGGIFLDSTIFTPGVSIPGTYIYEGAYGCTDDSLFVDITVIEQFNAGDFTQTTLCVNSPPVDLFSLIEGTPDPDGTFSIMDSGEAISNILDPSDYSPGLSVQLEYSGGELNCFDSSILEITFLSANANAGISNLVTVCSSDQFIEMIQFLNGNPQPGGTWTSPTGNLFGNFFTPGIDVPGTYTYTVSNSCGSDSATLTITTISGIEITNLDTECSADLELYTLSFDITGGSEPYFANGSPLVGSSFSMDFASGNPYSIAITGSGNCDGVVVQGTSPDCPCPAFAQWSSESDTICLGETYDLQIDLEGQPPFDVIYEVNGLPVVLSNISDGFTLNLAPGETTSYTLLSVSDANCITELNQTFTLTISESGDCCPEISVEFLTPDTTLCANDELCVQAEISGGTPPYFFSYLDVNNQIVIPVSDYFPGDCIEQIQNVSNTYVLDFFYSDANNCTNAIPFDTLQITTDPDTDGDGICDSDEIVGCQNPNALNYNPLATDPGPCEIDGGLSEDIWELSEIQVPFGDSDYDWTGIQIDDFDNSSWDFVIYPNPSSNGTFQIAIRGNTTPSAVEIYAADGRLIYSETIQTHSPLNEIHLDLSNGLYNVLLRTQSGTKTHKLLIKK